MQEHKIEWLDNLREFIDNKEFENAVNHITKNYEVIFSTPNLHSIYSTVTQIPSEFFIKPFSKLLIGWLCFACGDNKRVAEVFSQVKETELETAEESSSYYGLKAIASMANSEDGGLRYAKLAVDVLPSDSRSFIAGNAHMTYGQRLANINRYRDAAKHFDKGFQIFSQNGTSFLSISCFVNQCLNLYAIGMCREVIEKCQSLLIRNSSKDTEMSTFMDIIKLPMGMCYYQMNKISMAVDALESAKSAISQLKLVHMHGIIEWYLFHCYRLKSDKENMQVQIQALEDAFQNLPYPHVKNFVTAMRVIKALSLNQRPEQEWVEELELAYELTPKATSRYLMGVLAGLSITGYSQIINEKILIKHLEELRFIGNISEIQSISLYLSEMLLDKGNHSAMKVYMNNALDIYKEYGILVQFINRNLKCLKYLEELNPDLAALLHINMTNVELTNNTLVEGLTTRELEILLLITKGKTNREIAEELFISVGTIKWHINNIFGKLQVKKRFEAIEKARKLKLI